uniref:Uncharacterized protein n=1 Tax=Romanomermis culicivorax TaxID=13658 RepID=A0A915L863_ROMCU
MTSLSKTDDKQVWIIDRLRKKFKSRPDDTHWEKYNRNNRNRNRNLESESESESITAML